MYDRIRRPVQKLRWSARYYGLDLTIISIILKVLSFLGRDLGQDWYKRTTSKRFDKRFGVDTEGIIIPDELDISGRRKEQAIQYQPTSSVTFGLVLSELPIEYEKYVFVDYGSGKGRALLMAAHFPFKRIIGVEISHSLHQAAQDNICRFLDGHVGCSHITSICEDAATFRIPDDPLVIYFFHPFNEEVLTEVLSNIRRSLRHHFRHMMILYYHSEKSYVLGEAEFLRRVDMRIKDPKWEFYDTYAEGLVDNVQLL